MEPGALLRKENGRNIRQRKRWCQQQRVEGHCKHTCGCYILIQVLAFQVLFSTRNLGCILDSSSFLICSSAALLMSLFHFLPPSDWDWLRTKTALFSEALWIAVRLFDTHFREIITMAYARTISWLIMRKPQEKKCLPGYSLTSPETYQPAKDMDIQISSQLAALQA